MRTTKNNTEEIRETEGQVRNIKKKKETTDRPVRFPEHSQTFLTTLKTIRKIFKILRLSHRKVPFLILRLHR